MCELRLILRVGVVVRVVAVILESVVVTEVEESASVSINLQGLVLLLLLFGLGSFSY